MSVFQAVIGASDGEVMDTSPPVYLRFLKGNHILLISQFQFGDYF